MKLSRYLAYLPTILIVFLITTLITRVYLHPGVPMTHDGENHLARFANYKIALKEGQFPPRFAPNLYHRYGYPAFNYNYPLPSLLALPFTLIKLQYPVIFKILMTTSLLAVGVGVFTWLKLLKVGWGGRIVGVLSVMVSPYLFGTIVYRGSIGEVMALALGIWIAIWIEHLGEQHAERPSLKQELPQFLLGSVGFITFFLSHNVTVLFGTPLLLLLAVWKLKNKRTQLLTVFSAFAIGILGSLWFWLPALMEQSAIIVGSSSLAQQYANHFPTLSELMSSPLQFGFSFIGPVDSLSFGLGMSQWFVFLVGFVTVLLAVLAKIKKMKWSTESALSGFVFITLLLVLFQLPVTSFIWKMVPLARFIQFPWRLGLFTTATLALLTGLIFQTGVRWQRMVIVVLILIQAVTVSRLQPVDYVNKDRIEYEAFEQSTTTGNENLAKDFTFQEFKDWQPTAILESGKGTVTVERWTGSSRSYTVIAETPVTLIEPTMYFLGWQTEVTPSGGKSGPVLYINSKTIQGRIAYQLEPGTYQVSTRFLQNTPARVVGNTVSLVTLLTLGVLWLTIIWQGVKKKHT